MKLIATIGNIEIVHNGRCFEVRENVLTYAIGIETFAEAVVEACKAAKVITFA